MPQLNAEKAAEVDRAEGGNFEPVPESVYVLFLADEVTVEDGQKGPYWKWTFKIDHETEGQEAYKGRQLWTNTSLAENAAWKLKEVFAAFGVPTSTNTDELIGRKVKAFVVQRTIQQGARKGDLTNEIKQFYALDADTTSGPASSGPAAGASKKADAVPLY